MADVDHHEIEVIPSETTILTPIYDEKDNLDSICIWNGGKNTCLEIWDTVYEPKPYPNIKIELVNPAYGEAVVKLVKSDS